MSISWEEAEFLLQIARDAAGGAGFVERFSAISDGLLALIPGVALSAALIDPAPTASRARALFRNQDPESLEQYLSHYRLSDPMGHGIDEARGTALTLSDCIRDREFGRDAFTGELLPRLGVRYILGIAVPLPRGERLAIAMHRPRALGDFTRKERRLIEIVGADLGRAALGSLLRERLEEIARAQPGALDARAGVLVIQDGEVDFADPGARELLRRYADRLRLSELTALACQLSAGREADEHERRIPLQGDGALRLTLTCLGAGSRVLVVLELLGGASAPSFDELVERAGLTPRQRDVVRLAATGQGNAGIAYRLGISEVTVGVHLTKAYRKLGVAGRVELAALFGGAR